MGDLAPVLVGWGFFGSVAWIVWVVSNARRRKEIAKIQADMQARLLDKLSASQDLTEFLKTDAGQHLLDSAATETSSPHQRILGSVQAGLILTLLGIAMFIISRTGVVTVTLDNVEHASAPLTIFGTICGSVGVGFLISAAISYSLSKSWGLFDRSKPAQR